MASRPTALAIVLLLAAAGLASSATAAPGRSASAVYTAGTGSVDCETDDGGACFVLAGDERSVDVGVVDDTGTGPTAGLLEVLGADGEVLSRSTFCRRIGVELPRGAHTVAVAVPALDATSCAGEVAHAATGRIVAQFGLGRRTAQAVDVEPRDCVEALPAELAIPADAAADVVSLDVLVLLNGVSVERGAAVAARADEAYRPLGLRLVPKFREVELTETRSDRLIGEAAALFGGVRPKGVDLVYVLTAKKMNVVGQADCLGGVRFANRGFAVGWDVPDRKVSFAAGVEGDLIADYSAKNMAHELGHLMGAQHFHANCVEGSCTIMQSPNASGLSLRFSSVNGASVRGHALRWARP